VLRPLEEADVTDTYPAGLNDPEVSRHLVGSRERAQTVDSVREYVRINHASPHDVLFGIFIDDALRGTVRLHDVDQAARTARLGVLIFDRAYWGKGWASRALSAVMDFAAGRLGLTRFWAGMRHDNLGSRRTFEGLGFVYQPSEDWTDPQGGLHYFFLLSTPEQR
jgi:RimJ/RimL family protein N-acetyltransferase